MKHSESFMGYELLDIYCEMRIFSLERTQNNSIVILQYIGYHINTLYIFLKSISST